MSLGKIRPFESIRLQHINALPQTLRKGRLEAMNLRESVQELGMPRGGWREKREKGKTIELDLI